MENASRPCVEFCGVKILLLLSREISSVLARPAAAQNSAKILPPGRINFIFMPDCGCKILFAYDHSEILSASKGVEFCSKFNRA